MNRPSELEDLMHCFERLQDRFAADPAISDATLAGMGFGACRLSTRLSRGALYLTKNV